MGVESTRLRGGCRLMPRYEQVDSNRFRRDRRHNATIWRITSRQGYGITIPIRLLVEGKGYGLTWYARLLGTFVLPVARVNVTAVSVMDSENPPIF